MRNFVYLILVSILGMACTLAPGSTLAHRERLSAEVSAQTNMGGNALHLLPKGQTEEVELIGIGEPSSIQIPVIVRNNSDVTIFNPSVKVTIRDTSGTLLGVAEPPLNHVMKPTVLEPGHVAIGFVMTMFIGAEIPPDADLAAKVSYEEDEPGYYLDQQIEFEELNFTGTTIVGEVVNPSDEELSSVYLMATCVSNDGQPLSSNTTTVDERISPYSSTSFQMIGVFGDMTQCEHFLISGSGSSRD